MKKIFGMAVFGLLILSLTAAAQQAKIALVIGNANYTDLTPLRNPVNDAEDMTTALEALDFTVTTYTDIGKAAMEQAIRDFAQQLNQRNGIGLFYFAGHGVQYQERNYLAPSDAVIGNEVDIKYQMMDAEYVLEQMAWANNRMNIVILDACRADVPFLRSVSRAGVGRGLVEMTAPKGTVLAFATSKGSTAKDGDGRNGVFTGAILGALRENPCRSISDLLINVAGRVDDATHGEQLPWQHLMLTRPFALAECVTPPPAPPQQGGEQTSPLLNQEGTGVVSCWENETPGATCKEDTTGMEFVYVPGGCFQMGSNDNDYDSEKPVHKVCLEGFWMGKYEVTNAQYRRFKPDHKNYEYEGKSLNGDEQPVVMVSWNDAQALVAWLTKQGRGVFRLPTEAEWEYAARGGTETIRYWGDDPKHTQACQYANVHDRTSKQAFSGFTWQEHACDDGYAVTAPVGQFEPNAFGLYDMLGNVWEWQSDTYHDTYKDAPTDGSAWGSLGDEKAKRLLRGGSWFNVPSFVRSALRYRLAPVLQSYNLGIRLVFSRTP